MSLQRLEFSKDWTDRGDFPTYQASEEQVRRDMQLLHDETKAAFNQLVDNLNQPGAGAHDLRHGHENKGALDAIGAVSQALGDSPDRVPSEKAVSDALIASGAMAAGGETHQVLVKLSAESFDIGWQTQSAGHVEYDRSAGSLDVDSVQQALGRVESVLPYSWKLGVKKTLAGSYTYTVPEHVTEVFAVAVGGGGSGGAWYGVSPTTGYPKNYLRLAAQGGGSGLMKKLRLSVSPGQEIPYAVGAGGASVTAGGSLETAGAVGKQGGASSFGPVTAPGGGGGNLEQRTYYDSSGRTYGELSNGPDGGVGADTLYTYNRPAPHIGDVPRTAVLGNLPTVPTSYTNGTSYSGIWQDLKELEFPFGFLMDFDLFAGALAMSDCVSRNYNGSHTPAQVCQVLRPDSGGGAGSSVSEADAAAQGGLSPGAGGGGAVAVTSYEAQLTATSGAGAGGAVYIFERHQLA